jgi:hypothetical protein
MEGYKMIKTSLVIPARESAAVKTAKGQILKIIQVEGHQVADFNSFNLHNFKEHFSASKTRRYNGTQAIKMLYSDAPYENVMFTVVEDTVRVHDLYCDRCSKKMYQIVYKVDNHPNCQDNLARAIEPYGLGPEAVHDTFNVFMNIELLPDGRIKINTAPGEKGDFIALRAEMDCLVAISACPADLSPCNNYRPTPIMLEIESQ